jgi:hypothetical protein
MGPENHVYCDGYALILPKHSWYDENPYPDQEAFLSDVAEIVCRNNRLYNLPLTVSLDPGSDEPKLINSTIHISKEASRRNLDYRLSHESGHFVQLHMFGFDTTHEMIHAASGVDSKGRPRIYKIINSVFLHLLQRSMQSDVLTATEQGARDWEHAASILPPFIILNKDHKKTIFDYFSDKEGRENLARGLRDIHCDVLIFKNNHPGFQKETETIKPETPAGKRLLSEFREEVNYTINQLHEMQNLNRLRIRINESSTNIIRKYARFSGLCCCIGKILDDPSFYRYAYSIDSALKQFFGETSNEYEVFRAVSEEFTQFGGLCFQQDSSKDRLYQSLHTPDQRLRIGVAKTMGNNSDIDAVSHLLSQISAERDPDARHIYIDNAFEIVRNRLSDKITWKCFSCIMKHGDEKQKQQLLTFLSSVNYIYFYDVTRLLKHYPQYVTSDIILSFQKIRPDKNGIPAEIIDLLKIYHRHHNDASFFEKAENGVSLTFESTEDMPRHYMAAASVIAEIGKINFAEALDIIHNFLREEDQSLRLAGIHATMLLADVNIEKANTLLLQLVDAYFLPWITNGNDEAYTEEALLNQAEKLYKSYPYIIFETFRAMSHIGKQYDTRYKNIPNILREFVQNNTSHRNLYIDLCITHMLLNQSLRGNEYADFMFNIYHSYIYHSYEKDFSGYKNPYTIQTMRAMYADIVAKQYIDGKCSPQYAFARLRQCNALTKTSIHEYIARQNPYLALGLVKWAIALNNAGHTNEIMPLVSTILSVVGPEHPHPARTIIHDLMDSNLTLNDKIRLIRIIPDYVKPGSCDVQDATQLLERCILDETNPCVRAAVADTLVKYISVDPVFVFDSLDLLLTDSSDLVQHHAIRSLIRLDGAYSEQVKKLLKRTIHFIAENPTEESLAIHLLYALTIHGLNHPNSTPKVVSYIQHVLSDVPKSNVILYGIARIGQILQNAKNVRIYNFDEVACSTYEYLRLFCIEQQYAQAAVLSITEFASIGQINPLANNPYIQLGARANAINFLTHEQYT